jgi:hypothetical protein
MLSPTMETTRDAELYMTPAGRKDFSVFESLYGLHPAVVQTICKFELYDILSNHLTIHSV